MQLSQKLLPATDPEEKAPAVKRLMALVARRVRQSAAEHRSLSPLTLTLTEPEGTQQFREALLDPA